VIYSGLDFVLRNSLESPTPLACRTAFLKLNNLQTLLHPFVVAQPGNAAGIGAGYAQQKICGRAAGGFQSAAVGHGPSHHLLKATIFKLPFFESILIHLDNLKNISESWTNVVPRPGDR
jgi:hypothetical protein